MAKMRWRKETPCNKALNQSMSSITRTPLWIYLILPEICSSRGYGANPGVTQTKAMNPIFLVKIFFKSFIILIRFSNSNLF